MAKSTRIIHHSQLLMTKFGRILCLTRKWHQKCSLLPAGVLLGILGGGIQILTQFQTKNRNFRYPFSDLALRQKLIMSLLRLERKQTNSSKPFRIRIFLFLSYSFGTETINTLTIQSRSSLRKPRFQTKPGKVFTHFQTKTA